ncbi:MAG: hypothetical protein ACRDZN_09380 [Acidimicrobiales bacterium]
MRAGGATPRAGLAALLGLVAACSGGSGQPTTTPAATDVTEALAVEEGDAARLTPAGESWIDPEVLRSGAVSLMTWQDSAGGVWVAEVDPDTGLLVEGSASQVGDGAAPLRRTFNGPEFGVDETGWAVYYTRLVDGREQVARVEPDGTPEILTSGEAHFSSQATTQRSSSSTRLVMLRRPPEWGTALWIDVAEPGSEHELAHFDERTDGDARWAVGTNTFVTNAHPDRPGQLSLVDTDTGAVVAVSDDPGTKTTPYAWEAPEGDGGLFVLAIVDGTELVVWGEDANGHWRQRATMSSPDGAHPYLGSPEPFVAGGRSYVSLAAADTPIGSPARGSQQVWIVGIDPEAPFARRCDDGSPEPVFRGDPEVLLGADQAFVYYNVFGPDGVDVYRCATAIKP